MSNKLRELFNPKPPTGMHKVLEFHRMTDQSTGGFLTLCQCGDAVDSDTEHWAEKLAEEGFGDLKPARALVTEWRGRAKEITEKAQWMAGTGASKLSLVYSMTKSHGYRYLSGKLEEALGE